MSGLAGSAERTAWFRTRTNSPARAIILSTRGTDTRNDVGAGVPRAGPRSAGPGPAFPAVADFSSRRIAAQGMSSSLVNLSSAWVDDTTAKYQKGGRGKPS